MQRDNYRIQENKEEIRERIAARCVNESLNDINPNLQFFRYSNPTSPKHGLYLPSVCFVAQGAKEVLFGEEKIRYDANNYLIISVDVPVVSKVIEASPDKPYLAFKLEIDSKTIASVMMEMGQMPDRNDASVKSMAVSPLNESLLDAFVRLVRLIDDPEDDRMVSSMVIREITYRILRSEQGARLRQMAQLSGTPNRIGKAVEILRRQFSQSLSIEDMAQDLGMSLSSFHHHFKTATTMSPLQFQKSLRLQEASRLLMVENYDAHEAASKVGYEDASQFNREYKRMFGEPPMRDVMRFKQLATTS